MRKKEKEKNKDKENTGKRRGWKKWKEKKKKRVHDWKRGKTRLCWHSL